MTGQHVPIFCQHLWSCSYLPNKNYQKQEMQKYIYIYTYSYPTSTKIFGPMFPKSKKHLHLQTRRKKTPTIWVDIFFTKKPPFATCDLESGSHLCCWYLQFYDGSFSRSGDPPGSFTGWKPMVRNESDWRFFQMLRMCWCCRMCFFLAHECHHRLRGSNLWCQLVCGVGGVGVWSRMFILIYCFEHVETTCAVKFGMAIMDFAITYIHPEKLTLRNLKWSFAFGRCISFSMR